ncbi:MAG: LPS export ABC transporter periplasmic protein LptC, partial [Acidobacteriota bacterium]
MSLVRSLRWILLAGLTALAAFVGVLIFTYPSAGLDLPSLEDLKAPETTRTVTQRSTHVEILRTRGGLPTLLLQAAESKTYPGGDLDLTSATFRLFDAQGQETVVEASRALSSGLEPDAQEPHGGAEQAAARSALFDGIGSWVLQGGVTLHGAGEMTLKTQALIYLENEGKARTNQPVTFTRGLVEGSATGMVYDVGTQTIQFLKDLHASMRVGQIGLV